jgi:hypothetical protein
MNTKIDELFATLRGLVSDQSRDLAIAMAGLASVAKERDDARQSLRASEQEVEELDTLCNDFRRANARLVTERDAARGFNDILKGVNLRLTADLRAAMERLNHAESIIMQ